MPGGWNLVLYYSYFPRYLLSIHIYSQSFEYIQADFVKMPASFPQPSINPMWSVHLGLDQNPFLAFDYPPRYSFHDSSASQENVNTNNDNDNGNDQTRTEDETPGRSRRHRDHASRTRHRRGHRNRQQTSAGPGTGEGRPPRVGLPFSGKRNSCSSSVPELLEPKTNTSQHRPSKPLFTGSITLPTTNLPSRTGSSK